MGAAANAAGRMPPDDLFRPEALQAQQTRWLGEIHIATPPRHWIVVSEPRPAVHRRHRRTKALSEAAHRMISREFRNLLKGGLWAP